MTQNLSPQVKKNAQNIRQKTPEEKLKFLKREEINTMQKDVGRLREAEAREAALKITQAKNPEDIKKALEKKEQAQTQAKAQTQTGKKQSPEPGPYPEKKPESWLKTEKPPLSGQLTQEPIPDAKKENNKTSELDVVKEEERKMERDLSWLPEQKIPLEKELKQLQDEIENIRSAELDLTLREEKKFEEEKRLLEEQERTASFQDRQTIESKRWEIERKRKEAEEKKWQIEAAIEEKGQKIQKIKIKLLEIAEKEKKLETEIKNASEKIQGIKFQKDRQDLQNKLTAADAVLEKLENDFQNIKNQKAAAEKNFNEILISEKALEEEISILEEKESKTANLAEQKEIEQKRWNTDSLRKKTEGEKWQQQAKNKEIEQQFQTIYAQLQERKKERGDLESKLREIDDFLRKVRAVPEPPQKPTDQKNELPVLKPLTPPLPPQPFFKPEQKIPVPKKEPRETLPSPLKRLLVRAGVFVVFLTVIALLAWFFVLKNIIFPTAEPVPSPSVTPSPLSSSIEPQAITAPAALIAATDTRIIEIGAYSELQNIFFEKALIPENEQEQFTRILIKDLPKNRFLGLKEFFEAFEITAPQGFYENIDNDFTLFIYSTSSSTNDSRVGFVTKIKKKDNLADLMNAWEKTMADDLELLFSKGIQRNQTPISSVFKNAYFKQQQFRYQTFSKDGFGICYGIISSAENSYLVFATSGKSMLQTIDLITNN